MTTYYQGEHTAESPCPCLDVGLVRVTLGTDLYNRARCRPSYSPDSFARDLAAFESRSVLVVHRFAGPGGVHSYTLDLEGASFHVPARFVVESEQS